MPAVTSVHNEGRWIGSSWVSDEVGRGHRPSPDQGHGSLSSRTMGRSSQIHAGDPRGRGAAATTLTLLKNPHFQIRPCPCRPCRRVCPLSTQKATAEPVQWNECECGNLSRGGTVPSHSKDHTQDKLAQEQRTASENRKEDAARMSAGSLHEIAHTMEHVFNVSHFLLSSSVLLFSDKSWDLSQLPHFSLFRRVCHCCL